MVASGVGLQTHIWNNNARSLGLMALYPVLIIAMLWVIAFVIGYLYYGGDVQSYEIVVNGDLNYLPQNKDYSSPAKASALATHIVLDNLWLVMAIISGWFVVAYFFHSAMINKLSHAKPVTRKEEPALYNLLENLCISQGVPMPKLNIIESHARNAFASGINEKTFAVTVTRGLMNSLQKDELEGVLAHELAHIMNRDVRLLMVTVIFTGMIGFAAQMVWSNIRYGMIFSRGSQKKGGAIFVMLAIAAVLWIGYMATLFMRFAVSRKREYMADAGAVQMTKNPEAMMRALMRISGRDNIPETTDDIMMMCVENKAKFMGLFATHPPIDERIQALSLTTNTPIPQLSLPPASKGNRFGGGRRSNPWLTRARRK